MLLVCKQEMLDKSRLQVSPCKLESTASRVRSNRVLVSETQMRALRYSRQTALVVESGLSVVTGLGMTNCSKKWINMALALQTTYMILQMFT